MRFKITAALLIVFVLLFGYVYFYEINQPDPQQQARQVFEIKQNDVSSVELLSKNQNIVLQKKEDQWTIVKPRQVRLDQKSVDNLVKELTGLKSHRIVAEGKNFELKKYGLKDPRGQVQMKLKDGQQNVLYIGNQTPVRGGYYVRKNEEKKVYRIGESKVQTFSQGVNDLRDPEIFVFDSSKIKKVAFSNPKTQFNLSKEKENWILTKPHYYPAKSVSKVIDNLTSLKAKSFIDEPESLAKYGLKDGPQIQYNLNLADKDKPVKIKIGMTMEQSSQPSSANSMNAQQQTAQQRPVPKTYLKIAGKDTIYEIDSKKLRQLTKGMNNYIDDSLFIFDDPNQVEYLNVKETGKSNLKIKPGAKKKDKQENKDNQDSSKSLAEAEKSLLNRLSFLKAGDYQASYQEVKDKYAKPFLQFSLKMKDSEQKQTVEFYRKKQGEDNYNYYVIKDITAGKGQDYDKLLFTFEDYKMEQINKKLKNVRNPGSGNEDGSEDKGLDNN
mgnify:CR=1 FL=1